MHQLTTWTNMVLQILLLLSSMPANAAVQTQGHSDRRGKDHFSSGLDSTKQVNILLYVRSKVIESKPVKLETRSQSYKHFTIINYDSRVVIWANL